MKQRYTMAYCLRIGVGLLCLLLAAPGAWAQLVTKIYYTQGSSTATLDAAKAVNPDGTAGATLASAAASFSQPTDIVVDNAGGFLYVADQYVSTGGILRFTTAGTGRTVIVPPTAGATYNGLALDVAGNRLFFTQGSATDPTLDALKVVNLSTLAVTTLASGATSFTQPTDLVLNAATGLLYVTDQFTSTGAILSFTTSGGGRTVVVPATANADYNGLALDAANNRLFFTQASATASLDALKVVNLSTLAVTTLASGSTSFTQPTDLAYDAAGGFVYVTDQYVSTGGILRFSTAGTGRTQIVAPTAGATYNGLALAANSAPVVTTSSGTTVYTHNIPGPSTPVAVDAAVTVTDADNTTLASATVSITGNFQSSQDVLGFTNNGMTMGNVVASYNAGTGVLTLTSAGATATLAQWQAALRAITYANSATVANTSNRTVAFAVNDGSSTSNTATKTISLTLAVAAPVVLTPANGSSTNNNTPTYSGTAPASATVTVVVDGSAIGTTTASAGGNWSLAQPTSLADGSHTVRATATVSGVTSANSNTNTFTVDTTPPAAPVVVAPANGSVTSNTTPVYSGTAEANSTVTVFVDGIAVGTATASASGNWSLTQPTALANGSHTVRARATDAVGNTSVDSNTNTFTVDNSAPVITSVGVPANGTYKTGDILTFTVNFNEVVTVNTGGGTPTLGLAIGATGRQATYVSGSGTSALVFRYTVVAGELDTDGITLASALVLNGGTIQDTSANNAVLTLNGVASTTGVLVDAVAPTVTSINRQTPAAALTNATTLVYRVTFSEPVNGVGPTDFTLTGTGTASGSIAFATLVSSSVYDVTVNSVSGNGTLRLDLNSSGTGISDVPGNPIAGGFTGGQAYTLDHTAPTVAITSTAANPTSTSPIPVTVTFSESVTGFTAADVTVGNGTLSGFSGSGTTYTFSITPTATGLVTVNISAGSAQDAAGNDNTAAMPFSIQYNAPLSQVVWNGSVSTDWFDANNWTGGVPTALLDALIPAGAPRYPVLTTGTATAKTLTLASGGSLSPSGGILDLKGDFVNNGTLTATGGTISFSGAGSQAVGGSSLSSFWNLSVGAAGAALSGAGAVQRVLTLSGNLATNSNPFTLLSNAGGTALVVNSGGVVTGTATVQRYIDPSLNPGPGYRHYSSPVQTTTVADLTTSGFAPTLNPTYNASATPNLVTPFPTVFGYDQSRLTLSNNLSAFDKGFFSPAALSDALAVGRGYTVNIAASQLVDFVGTLTTGDQPPLALARNAGATAADAGWQFLGNPYPAPLDYSLVAPADRVNLDGAMYVFASTSQYGGTYRSYVNGVGGNPVLPVAQGFFVRVSTGQTSGSLTFRNSQRLTTPAATTFQRTTTETRPLLQLTLGFAGTTLTDDAYVYFQAGATAGVDAQFDAVKLPNPNGLNLATVAAGTQLAINGLPVGSPVPVTVPMFIGVPVSGTYTLHVAQLLNFVPGAQPFLHDLQLNTLTDLSQQATYTFSMSATSTAPRFELVFGPQQVLGTASAALAAQVAVFPNPASKAVFMELPASLSHKAVSAALVDALGRAVLTQVLPAGLTTHTLPLTNVATGVYSLRLQTEAGMVVKKLVVE